MNSWFTVSVKYTKQLDNGKFKRVSEPYLIAAMTFTEAESRIYEELGSLIRGEFIVTAIKRTEVHDVFQYDDSDVWFKIRIVYENEIDDEGSKMKKVSQYFMVSAHSVKEAYDRLRESLGVCVVEFQITSCVVSPIVDIFPFDDKAEKRTAVTSEIKVNQKPSEHDDVPGNPARDLALMLNCRDRSESWFKEADEFALKHNLCVVFVDEQNEFGGDCYFKGVTELQCEVGNEIYLESLGGHRDKQGRNAAIFSMNPDGDWIENENRFECLNDCKEDCMNPDTTEWPWLIFSTVKSHSFGIFENNKPYCKGIVFSVADLK